MLHSNEQLMTEKDGDTEEGCHKPAVQQKTTELNCRTTLRFGTRISQEINYCTVTIISTCMVTLNKSH